MRLFRFALLLAAGVTLLPSSAHAQTKVDHYGYEFIDDHLLGDTLSSPPPLLKVRPRPLKVMLIRPRTGLVGELLKTVETL